MSHQLSFAIRHHFTTTDTGITIPVTLMLSGLKVTGPAKVDTGSEWCLLQREMADELQIEVMDGIPIRMGTLLGTFTAYAHTVELQTLGLSFESTVLFTTAYGAPRNILGRRGWLEHLHLGLTMDEEAIYLNSIYPTENL